jgi:hypothetical protein
MSVVVAKQPKIKCLNCGESFKGSYCWNCGQSAKVTRFSLKEILEEFFLAPLHIHPHGLLYTFIWLFRQPGDVIRRYVEGQRKLLHPAFRYLILAGTFATIVIAIYHPFEMAEGESSGVLFIGGDFFEWVSGHVTLINLIAIPLYALGSYIFFKPVGFNYAENLTLQAYIASQQLWILVVFLPIFQFAPSLDFYVSNFYSVITVIYNIYVVMHFFRMLNFLGFILSVFAYIYATLLQVGVTFLYYSFLSHYIGFSIH